MTEHAPADPYSLLCALTLDDGRSWGDVATDWQRTDALAVLVAAAGEPGGLRRQFNLRGRGMSKTTDVAALALVLLLTKAPARSRSHAYAVDSDQSAILLDTLQGLAERSGLMGLVTIDARTVTVRKSHATLTIESADGASAFGLRPWLTVVDELGVWPSTENYRKLWSAIISAVPKRPDSLLLVIGTAGSPIGLGARVWTDATDAASTHWRATKRPGPAPWWSEADIAATRADLTASEWRRLILCEFAEGDDALTSPEDVAAVIRPGSTTLAPRRGVEYVAALDVGTRRDLTALAVGHVESRAAGRVVVVDRVMYWRPGHQPGDTHTPGASGFTLAARVDLAEVEASTLRICKEYSVSRLRFDRMQAEQLTMNLERQGIKTDEFVFSTSGANRLARALWGALRDRALDLPDDDELRDEFLATRLVETAPGVVKLQNPPGSHDDIVTAVGMLVAHFADVPEVGGGSITVPTGNVQRQLTSDRRIGSDSTSRGNSPNLMLTGHMRTSQRVGSSPKGLPGGPIVGIPGAYDDPGRSGRRSWDR